MQRVNFSFPLQVPHLFIMYVFSCIFYGYWNEASQVHHNSHQNCMVEGSYIAAYRVAQNNVAVDKCRAVVEEELAVS